MTDVAQDTPGEVLWLQLPIDLPLADVIAAQQEFLTLIGHVATAMRPDQQTSWVVSGVRQASIDLQVRPVPEVPNVGHVIADGLVQVGVGTERPPFFTDDALMSTSKLAALSVRLPGMAVRNGAGAAPLTLAVATNADAIIDKDVLTEMGVVEGRLEAINVHRKDRRQFTIYADLDGQRVQCRFANRIPIEQVRDALERRVAVHGIIRYRGDRKIQRVEARRIEMLPREDELPSHHDVRGILGEAL